MHVTILGKSASGESCPFKSDELWGVNNVASQLKPCPDCRAGKITAPVTEPLAGIPAASTEIDCPRCKGTNRILQYPDIKFHKLFAFDFLEKWYTDDMKLFAPIVSWQPYADIRYPIEEVIKEFKTRYFTNTISYMIAYAIFVKVKKISIYGVDMSFGAPYAQENRGVEYWLARAQERGIELDYPPQSHLLRTVYGNMYGEQSTANFQLYLHERLGLINTLPQKGRYSEALIRQNAWWVLFPKEDEAKAHNVNVMRDPQGNMGFQAPKEYASDVQMPPEVWAYLKQNLIDIEAKGELPFNLISVYEKLILGKESTR